MKTKFDSTEINNPLILPKTTLEYIYQQNNPGELLTLYLFYQGTKKWMNTNWIDDDVDLVIEKLKWNKYKVLRTRKQLEDLKLIKLVRKGNFEKQLLKIKIYWNYNELPKPINKTNTIFKPRIFTTRAHTHAFKTKKKGVVNNLSLKKKINTTYLLLPQKGNENSSHGTLFENQKLSHKYAPIISSMFTMFFKLYPRKSDKSKALTEWNKICTRPPKERPTWYEIKTAIQNQSKTKRWEKGFIPFAHNWLKGSRWIDDPEQMNVEYTITSNKIGYQETGKTYRKSDEEM